MATISDRQAVVFVNEELRPTCDRLISAIRTLRQLKINYATKEIGSLVVGTQELTDSYIADGSTNPDGTKGDGRTPLKGYDIDLALGKLNDLLIFIDGSAGLEAALTKPSVNTQPAF